MNDKKVLGYCKQLRLPAIAEHIVQMADQASNNGVSYLDFATSLLDVEVKQRKLKDQERKMKTARLPGTHDLQDYDSSLVDGMPSARLEQLKELTWLDQNFNLVIMGPNGIGKTFLAAGLCHHAIANGYKAYFRPMDQIMTMLRTRDVSRSAQIEYRRLSTAHVIIIDDIMTINMARNEANVFFHFINALHEKVSFVITTNKSPKEWVETIGDEVITTAILDRLLYRCEIIKLAGESFRLKNRKTIFQATA
jgi:DNA replication protein DnaC